MAFLLVGAVAGLIGAIGGPKSKSTVTKITAKDLNLDQASFNVIKQACASSSTGQNVFEGSNLNISNSTINQTNIIENLCILQTAIKQSRSGGINSNVIEKINQDLKAEGGLPGTGGHSEAIQNLYTRLSINTNQKTVLDVTGNCILNQDARNIISLDDSYIYDSDISQMNRAFADCLMKNDFINNVDSQFKEEYESENVSKLSSTAIFGGAAGAGSSVSLSIVCIILVFLMIMNSVNDGAE